MKKGTLSRFLFFMFVCYVIIAGYIFLVFARIDMIGKLLTGIVFEVLSAIFIFNFIVRSIAKSQSMKTGYLIPIVMCTVLYTLSMNALNIWGSSHLVLVWFVLAHMIWTMTYILIVIPMYIMGKQ